jgi:hypothetical protein
MNTDFLPDDFVDFHQRVDPIRNDGSHCWRHGFHLMIQANVVYEIIDGFRYEVIGFLENDVIVLNRL